MIDVNTLAKAEHNEIRANGAVKVHVWYAEANGVSLIYHTEDLIAEFWVSPIWTMREKGVALVDSSGTMVKNERSDR